MSRIVLHQGRIFDFGLEDVTLPNGRQLRLEIIRHPGAAAVVPLHDDGTVTLVHQHRHAAGGLMYEIPAGVLDHGEAPDVAAAREMAEEVQLAAERLDLLTVLHTTPGFTDERIWVYLATGLRPADGAPEADEVLRPVRLPLEAALDMIDRGEITDAKTLSGLLLAARHRER